MSIRLLNSGVIIGGKYQITAALGGNPVGITYAGTAVQTAQKVIIREFMPQDCCERAADGSIINVADVFEQEKQKYGKKETNKQADAASHRRRRATCRGNG